MQNIEQKDELIHSAYADSLGYSYFILFLLFPFILTIFYGNWSMGSVLLLVILILGAGFITMYHKKMFFYKSYIIVKYPFNPFKKDIRIDKSDIINVSIPPWSWGKTSNSIVFQTKYKKIPYVTFDKKTIERLYENYSIAT